MVDRRRKWRAQHQNISIKKELDDNRYVVSGSSGNDYRVDFNKPFCECPDWTKRSPEGGCKHILKIKLKKGIIDPVPSAYTNFGNPKNRSRSSYSSRWDELAQQTKKRDNWTCQKCGVKGGQYGSTQLNAHHIITKKRGGKDNRENLITVCQPCHEEEHGHPIPQGSRFDSYSSTTSNPSEISSSNSKFENLSNSHSKIESSFSSSELQQDIEHSSIDDYSSSPSAVFNRGNLETILPENDKIRGEDYAIYTSLKRDLTVSLTSLFILSVIGLFLSVEQMGWYIIFAAALFVFLFFRFASSSVASKVGDIEKNHRYFENKLTDMQTKLESDENLSDKEFKELHNILTEIKDDVEVVSFSVNNEYMRWVSDTCETLFKETKSIANNAAEPFFTKPTEPITKTNDLCTEESLDSVTNHPIFQEVVSTLADLEGTASTAQIAENTNIDQIGAFDRLRTLEAEGKVTQIDGSGTELWKLVE